jgi:hypothetical protein
MDPKQPGEEACDHLEIEGLQTHVTPLTARHVTVYTVRGVPEYTFFYVKMACGLYFLVFRPLATAHDFIAAGYPSVELDTTPDEVAECYRREIGEDPLSEDEISKMVAELAGLATAEEGS